MPASFDPAARELTADAARAVGIENLVLLEEPQAALYNWVNDSHGSWRKQVRVGDIILVQDADININVKANSSKTVLSILAESKERGDLVLTRVAVGEHILLGGDNMDLALAHVVKGKLGQLGVELDRWQIQALTHGCRHAKERTLSEPDLDLVPVVVPSRGAKLVGGSIRTELTRDEVTRTLIDGFFPEVPASARPAGRARTALTKLGLPFAQDPAVTRHLAAFLGRQTAATETLEGFVPQGAGRTFLHPTAVLFNGGVFKAEVLRERVMQIIEQWLDAEGGASARLLGAPDLDLAVARGAAYYGYVRRVGGVRIRGGTAQSYYVGIESSMPAVPGVEPPLQALCLAPFGMEEGSDPEIAPQEFGLVVGEPVRFRFFGSSVRREDRVGTLIEEWTPDELEELEELQAELPTGAHYQAGDIVPVRLQAAVTEVGTLELTAIPRKGTKRWKVEFNVRGSGDE